MKKNYTFGDYYSPLDIIKIAKKKLKRMKLAVLLLPISSIIFLFNLITSVMLYPTFILNKYFYKLDFNYDYTVKKSVKDIILTHLIDFVYSCVYILYWFFMPINRLFAILYMIFPNEVDYFSNQTVHFYAKEVAKMKKKLYEGAYDMIENPDPEDVNVLTKEELDKYFEQEFFHLINSAIAKDINQLTILLN